MCFIGGLSGAIVTPSYIQIQSKVDPSLLALVLIIPMLIRTGQSYLSRLSDNISLILPLYLVIFDICSLLVLLISPLWFVILDTVIGVLSTMLYINRSSVIMEKIKAFIDVRTYQNKMLTYSGIGAAGGFIISACLSKFLQPTTILLITGVLSSIIYIPYIQINNIVKIDLQPNN
jgi:hypothetical protein